MKRSIDLDLVVVDDLRWNLFPQCARELYRSLGLRQPGTTHYRIVSRYKEHEKRVLVLKER